MSHLSYSVLSIDGGGIRGIIPCVVLAEIEKRTGMPVSSLFDLIAGTSTGGLLAGGLTLKDIDGRPKNSAAEILKLYTGKPGKRIFKRKLGRFNKLRLLVKSLFPEAPLASILAEEFGDARLKDALTDLLLTAYNTQEKAPFYFKTSDARINPEEDCKIRDAIYATCAAPTYFPPKQMKYNTTFKANKVKDLALIDGGVYANNPSVLAFVEALQQFKQSPIYKKQMQQQVTSRGMTATVAPDNHATPFLLISLGTGTSGKKYSYSKVKRWGLSWLFPLIDILMQGVSESVHYQMQHLLPDYHDQQGGLNSRYYRFNIEIDKEFAEMSDVTEKNLNKLVEYGQEIVKRNDKELDKVCEVLMEIAKKKTAIQQDTQKSSTAL